LHFFDRQLQVLERQDYEHSKVPVCPKMEDYHCQNSQKMSQSCTKVYCLGELIYSKFNVTVMLEVVVRLLLMSKATRYSYCDCMLDYYKIQLL